MKNTTYGKGSVLKFKNSLFWVFEYLVFKIRKTVEIGKSSGMSYFNFAISKTFQKSLLTIS